MLFSLFGVVCRKGGGLVGGSRNVGERRVAVRIYWVEERGRNFVCYRRKKNKIFG